MRRVKQSKHTHNHTLFALSLLTLALNQVVYAEEPAAQVHSEATTELAPVQIRATPDMGYTVKNSSSATRTDTPIRQIPQSMQVIPRQLIDDQQNITVGETLKNVSGVVTNDEFSSPAFETTRIRGFAAEQLVDGFSQYYNSGDRESLVNIDKIEVLKGANAILYSGGAGTPVGGVVNINSKLPQAKAFGELGMKVGTDSFVQPFFDVNQPLTENMLFRVTGEYTKAKNNIDVIDQRRYNINPSLTFTNNKDTIFTLQGKASRWSQQEYQGLPAVGTLTGAFKIKSDLFIGNKDIPDSTSKFNGLWASLDHKFNDTWSFNAKARYSESKFDEKAQLLSQNTPDIPPSIWMLSDTNMFQTQKEQSVLLNTTAKFDLGATKNTVIVGADYTEVKDKGTMNTDAFLVFFGFAPPNLVDISNPVFATAYVNPPTSAFTSLTDAVIKNTTYGAYVQLQSTIYDRFHLLAALRQAHVGVNYDELTSATSTKTDKNKLLARIGGVFDVNDSFSVFANYAEGMRGQSFSIFAPNVKPAPAESRSKEIGVKFDVNSELTGQAALFHIDRTNVAVGFPATPTGEQRSRGFDTDITWRPNNTWSLLANYAHTNAKFTNNASATILAGNPVQGIPKNAARLWANYSFQQDALKGLSAGLGVNWQSGVYVLDSTQYKTESYHTVDASLAYKTDRFNLGLTVKNLTNQDYYQYYNYFGGRVRPDAGTSAYLSASFKY
ncbi:MAG: TonB-dependent siderophore receptor [Methylotenera sp.]|nr:TonB-dependent siderophore receptor [Methylotenera sp.]